jgi:hypothetical protein
MAVWRPPERIKHLPSDAPWPTRAQVEESRLFSPIEVGSAKLPTRTWVPAMVPWRASEDGEVTPAVLAWYERFARGRPAALVVEATGVRDIASGRLKDVISRSAFVLDEVGNRLFRARAGVLSDEISVVDRHSAFA